VGSPLMAGEPRLERERRAHTVVGRARPRPQLARGIPAAAWPCCVQAARARTDRVRDPPQPAQHTSRDMAPRTA
jgi:hypothetical protein